MNARNAIPLDETDPGSGHAPPPAAAARPAPFAQPAGGRRRAYEPPRLVALGRFQALTLQQSICFGEGCP